MARLRVIFIAGYGRSGSTVLDILLGNHEDVLSLGEVSNFFQSENRLPRCACGLPMEACDLWAEVNRRVSGQVDGERADWHRDWQDVERVRSLLPLVRGSFSPGGKREATGARYSALMEALFTALAEVTGKTVFVDSSKTIWPVPGRPYALYTLCDFDVRVVHLIRDGRAVMWSLWKGVDPDIEAGRARPSALRGYKAAFSWAAHNLLASWLLAKLPSERVMRLYYKDLVTQPLETLDRLGSFTGLDPRVLKERLAGGEPLQVGHLLRGNRVARQQDQIHLRPDDSWRQGLPPLGRALFWLTLWPVALAYRRRWDRRG
jgi:hypothetical protein